MLTTESRSGLTVPTPMYDQSQVLPDAGRFRQFVELASLFVAELGN
jgi:hypothetical protein